MDEVDFIQNLVYYVERAYRIPDYGMWERGSRDNVGRRELHARCVCVCGGGGGMNVCVCMVRSPIPTSCLQYLCAYMCVCRCVCICAYVNVYMCGDSVTLLSSFLLSSSSIGMTKAALEAMDGMNLFGEQGSLVSIIHVDPDAQYRNSVILNNLLPKESSSKETDASLLCISGYPAFAIDDPALRKKTEAKVKELLEVGIVHVTNFSISYPSEGFL